MEYRPLPENEITRKLFSQFMRRQTVTDCWRRIDGEWVVRSEPFVDDWSEEDYARLIRDLKDTVSRNGWVTGAFAEDGLKGFAAVQAGLFGPGQEYLDLASIHVSEDMRGRGIGKALFVSAKSWARAQGAQKLYISAHSSTESQAFYKAMGCVEAAWYSASHVAKEPYDCQLECSL